MNKENKDLEKYIEEADAIINETSKIAVILIMLIVRSGKYLITFGVGLFLGSIFL